MTKKRQYSTEHVTTRRQTLMHWPIAPGCFVYVEYTGTMTQEVIGSIIAHLQLNKECWPTKQQVQEAEESQQNEREAPYVVHYVTPRGSDAIQRFSDLLLQYNPLSVVVGRREIVVTWKQEEDEKRFQAAWKASLEPVKLYEDNIGNLYLHQPGSSLVYQVALPSASSFFENDCQDIASGDTANWNEELVHGYAEMQDTLRPPSTEHIATWYPDKPYELHQQPGEAGRRYLQLPSRENTDML